MAEHTPFLTAFPGCESQRDFCGGLEAIQTDDRCSAEYKRYLLSTAIWDLYAALRGEAAS
jgi:hypothetical protein